MASARIIAPRHETANGAFASSAGPSPSIGEYLIQRLREYGLRDVFGIPGDYILHFYSMLQDSPIRVIGCTREDCAGFAADAYARVNGLGAVCVTYCVGGLSLCNSIAGAFAEKSPVVVISGSPGLSERVNNPLLHHRVRDFQTQFKVFDEICIAATALNDARTAFSEIDRVLEAATRFKRPVYIEIPRDMVGARTDHPKSFEQPPVKSDADALREAVAEATRLIASSQKPVILAGVELHRFGLQDALLDLAEGSGIPVASTLLAKSVIREVHPLYVGLYEGAMGDERVTRFVEESDCVIMLGTFMTDLNLGIFTANLDPGRCIYATSEQLRIHHHHYHDVLLPDFIRELTMSRPRPPRREPPPKPPAGREFVPVPDAPIKIGRVVQCLDPLLEDQTVVIADIGDSLFAATELVTRGRSEFLSPAYYTSMGFSVPAALGVQVARREVRPIVLVGDGAFQMTGMELSTIVRHAFDPIILVMDNAGYGTERFLHPGEFNEIHGWNYHRLPEVLRGGKGYYVQTEGELDRAIKAAWADRSGMSLIQVKLDPADCSDGLRRLAARLSKRVRVSE